MKLITNWVLNNKSLKNKLLLPVATFLNKNLKLSSNQITLLSFISGIVAILNLYENHLIFIIFIVLSVIFDIFDGTVSKIENKQGELLKRGVLLDDLSDRSIILLLLLKIALYKSIIFLPALILAYIILKASHIIIKQKINHTIQITYIDRIPLIFIIFHQTQIALYIIAASLLINSIEIAIILNKHKKGQNN